MLVYLMACVNTAGQNNSLEKDSSVATTRAVAMTGKRSKNGMPHKKRTTVKGKEQEPKTDSEDKYKSRDI